MKKLLRTKRFHILLLILTLSLIINAAAEAGIGFTAVYDNLNLKKNTKLYVNEYWEKVEGKEVTWSGAVFDVKGGRGKAEVLIANRDRAVSRGHNIILIVPTVEKAARLRKGQQIRFKGYLHDFKSGKRGSVVIILRDAEIL